MTEEPGSPPAATAADGPRSGADAAEDAARAEADALLRVSGLTKTFGGIVALDGADLTVREGEIVGLVGPNGAGKSTLFNCITGVHSPDGGSVRLRDAELTGMRTPAIVQRGLARTFQIPRVFPDLTVRENMRVSQPHADESVFRSLVEGTDPEIESRIDDLLAFMGLTRLADQPASNLSTGQKKLLNIASTRVSDPEIVLLDEPAAGVNPGLVDEITDSILELNRDGATFLVIEHEMDVIRELSDYVYVLAEGTNLTEGDAESALEDPRVLEAYFGR